MGFVFKIQIKEDVKISVPFKMGHDIRSYDLKVELAKCFNGHGIVYLAQHLPSKQHVAIKKFLLEDVKNDFGFIMVSTVSKEYVCNIALMCALF